MSVFKSIPKPIWIFSIIWFVTGCIQAAFMDLHPDEAYYWQMSRFMDWGYFHQPPMIAIFIKVGYALFQNEFGVRLMTVVASTLGILMLFKLSETDDVKTFLLVYLGMILTHAGIFMAVPDSPLIFFTLIFLLLLKRYLERDSYGLAIILAVIVAALMYSKYHAIVLFGSVLLAAPKLLLRRSFWLLAILSIFLFLPHIFWQLEHDLVSFKFHWVVREKKTWDIMVLLDYLGVQLIMLGPVGIILVIALFKLKNLSQFDRILTTIVIGFFAFFFVLALRSAVEGNWTATAFLPLIVLGNRVISKDKKLLIVLKPIAIVCAVILLSARIYILSPWAGDGIKLNLPLKGWSDWAFAVKKKANGRPVFFSGTYQYASQYSFYSGEQGYHWSPINYNGNQFELWNMDKAIEGRPFVVTFGFGNDTTNAVYSPGFKPIFLYPQPLYHSYRQLRFEFSMNTLEAQPNEILELKGKLVNHTTENLNLDSLLEQRPLKIFRYQNGKHIPSEPIDCIGCGGMLKMGESKDVSFSIQTPNEQGKYFIRFGLAFIIGIPEQNSDFIKLKVTSTE
ncbi:MAG: glycosyltransferase family 39 protein [Flavobacteriales bacterium]|nr:glycosyltransferase family 39 protein [Flavobacteriales bacterium]